MDNVGKLNESHFDSVKLIHGLSAKNHWDEDDFHCAHFLSSKLEISGRLFLDYTFNGKKNSDITVGEEDLKLVLPILEKLLEETKSKPVYYKVCNAYFKLVEQLSKDLVNKNERFVFSDINYNKSAIHESIKKVSLQPYKKEVVIDLTVLYWESPIARAYLEMLRFMNIKPKKIIHLVSKNDISTGKPNFGWLPKILKFKIYAIKQFQSMNYWPAKLKLIESEQYNKIKKSVTQYLGVSDAAFDDVYKKKPLYNYSDNVQCLLVDNLKDTAIVQQLRQESGYCLFTGGGILTKQYFNLNNIDLIHIHPGFLPDIRGSDGVLWSMLLNGYPSASCFFMTPNLDDGEIIHRNFLGINFDLAAFSTNDHKNKYRMIFSYIDPWVRACILAEAIIETKLFKSIKTIKQDELSSQMFYTMHSELQRNVL